MRSLIALLISLWLAPAWAQVPMTGAGRGTPAAGGCTEATNFLARTSGLSGTETTAYTTLICGLVTDGVFSSLDALYIFATKDTTTAALNLIQNNYNLTSSGSGSTFTADVGYTGSSAGSFRLDTGFNASTAGGQYAQNSASYGAYVLNNRTSTADESAMGTNGASTSFMILLRTGNNLFYGPNNSSNVTTSNSTTQGLWITTRTASNAIAVYKNGNTTAIATSSQTSGALANLNFTIFANTAAGPTYERYSNDQLAAAFIGGGLSSANMALVAARLNAYMTTMGINVY